jgi:hypothetical protein
MQGFDDKQKIKETMFQELTIHFKLLNLSNRTYKDKSKNTNIFLTPKTVTNDEISQGYNFYASVTPKFHKSRRVIHSLHTTSISARVLRISIDSGIKEKVKLLTGKIET